MIETNKVYNEDCLEGMKKIDSESIDCVVSDPPYFMINDCGNGFMGQKWDSLNWKKQ